MNNIIEKCKTTRILAIIGVIGLFLGVILPYVKYTFWGSSLSITLWNYWEGKVIMVLILANVLFIFKDLVEKYMPSLFNSALGKKIEECDNPKMYFISIALVVVLEIIVTMEIGFELFRYFNLGFYCIWIGIISLVAYAILHKESNDISKM